MEIQLATFKDVPSMVKVLNAVTLDLLKKGINQWPYPWDPFVVKQAVERHGGYVVRLDAQITGAFYIYSVSNLSDLPMEPQSLYISKIAILPEYQGRNIGSQIIRFACSLTQKQNKTLYLDCCAGNEKLKDFYRVQGLEYVGDFPEEDYFISIFKSSGHVRK